LPLFGDAGKGRFKIDSRDSITVSRTAGIGASRPLRRILAIVSFLNPQMVYRGGRGTQR
jgi:hypothetical protein